ncbi:methyl-accepting chemotaxis protein [Hydrogenophaga sp.]|uniref:methyl-accepting chemotaxis protein n=1 Tax=Hydrogenophaga sp. TaxID=1904254 RepID=UPI00272F6F43|nr:methyl-accepting chemotaxis protein [Hydrogenophaga sp.]MDP2018294.1 methyl-accepting chemotaxis protein [Hydrogenophaga sp.]MDP3164025.1 methyl-accepting chemotaxis protein [Hydrogenophaga sp.]
MKIRHKLPLAIGVALLLVASAGLFGIQQLRQSLATYAHLIDVDYPQERMASLMLSDFKTQVQEWKNTLLRGKDDKQRDRYWTAFQKKEGEIASAATKLQGSLPEGEARELVGQFLKAHAGMGEGYRKGFTAFTAAGFDAAAGDEAVKGMDRAPSELIDKAVGEIAARSTASAAAAALASQRASALSLGLMLISTLAGIGAAVFIGRSITLPINQALRVAQTVAAGDLSSTIHVTSTDETGELLQALKAMNESLANVVAQVREGSESVATASAQISQGNQDLSQRTEEQASSLQQTAASMEQLGTTVTQNAENARQANQLAQEAREVAAEGGQAVANVVQTMKGINDSSRRIADIIGTIDGIAFQTNILALNAAVEAARAGEQGRGFAVVAGEVRNLAQRSAEAAREIKGLINASVQQVERGTMLVDQAGTTMQKTVSSIGRVTDIVGEITAASSEQSSGVAQVGQAVSQIDQATQQNAALVEESAAAAASLKHQAQQLVQAVAVFKLA